MLLALHGSWLAIHPRWNVFALDRAVSAPEAKDFNRWREPRERVAAPSRSYSRWLFSADPRGHILHFSGAQKPWDHNASDAAMCASADADADAAPGAAPGTRRGSPPLEPCALAWSEVARRSASLLGWLRKDGTPR